MRMLAGKQALPIQQAGSIAPCSHLVRSLVRDYGISIADRFGGNTGAGGAKISPVHVAARLPNEYFYVTERAHKAF